MTTTKRRSILLLATVFLIIVPCVYTKVLQFYENEYFLNNKKIKSNFSTVSDQQLNIENVDDIQCPQGYEWAGNWQIDVSQGADGWMQVVDETSGVILRRRRWLRVLEPRGEVALPQTLPKQGTSILSKIRQDFYFKGITWTLFKSLLVKDVGSIQCQLPLTTNFDFCHRNSLPTVSNSISWGNPCGILNPTGLDWLKLLKKKILDIPEDVKTLLLPYQYQLQMPNNLFEWPPKIVVYKSPASHSAKFPIIKRFKKMDIRKLKESFLSKIVPASMMEKKTDDLPWSPMMLGYFISCGCRIEVLAWFVAFVCSIIMRLLGFESPTPKLSYNSEISQRVGCSFSWRIKQGYNGIEFRMAPWISFSPTLNVIIQTILNDKKSLVNSRHRFLSWLYSHTASLGLDCARIPDNPGVGFNIHYVMSGFYYKLLRSKTKKTDQPEILISKTEVKEEYDSVPEIAYSNSTEIELKGIDGNETVIISSSYYQ